tara:strand:- start:534 stop:659 length:126 start_codon:yes stop_codon:yes gene_type:complete
VLLNQKATVKVDLLKVKRDEEERKKVKFDLIEQELHEIRIK